MEIWKFWTWEYAEDRWDWVHSMWRKNWNIPQKNRLARCSKKHIFLLSGHVITSFFHLPLDRGMNWALANGIRKERGTKYDLGTSFLHDHFSWLCLIDVTVNGNSCRKMYILCIYKMFSCLCCKEELTFLTLYKALLPIKYLYIWLRE